MKKTVAINFVATCYLLLLLTHEGSPASGCQIYNLPAPLDCMYGTALDWCHNGVCAKGPGQQCGGYRWEHGKCSKGTSCMCGVCIGCSLIDGSCYANAPKC